MLHGEERITYPAGPLRVGDELAGSIEIVGDERREGSSRPLRLISLHVDLRRPDGEVAATVDRLLVVPGENSPATSDSFRTDFWRCPTRGLPKRRSSSCRSPRRASTSRQ